MNKVLIVSVLTIFATSAFAMIVGQWNLSDLPSVSADVLDTTSYCSTHYPAGPRNS